MEPFSNVTDSTCVTINTGRGFNVKNLKRDMLFWRTSYCSIKTYALCEAPVIDK